MFARPFTLMDDDELNYALPLFLAEVLKKDGSMYPPATLRGIVLSLQKHLEINGRHVKFLTDTKFKPVRDTLDAVMKRSASMGLGMNHRQATVIRLTWRTNFGIEDCWAITIHRFCWTLWYISLDYTLLCVVEMSIVGYALIRRRSPFTPAATDDAISSTARSILSVFLMK